MSMMSKLWGKLRDRAYRKAFVAEQLKRNVPFQIRTLRKKRGWSQQVLATEAGLTQGVISRAEDSDYGNLTFNTVVQIAAGFDLAFIGKFVPFSKLEEEYGALSEDSVEQIPTFEEEDQAKEKPEPMLASSQCNSNQKPAAAGLSNMPKTPKQGQLMFNVIKFPTRGIEGIEQREIQEEQNQIGSVFAAMELA